ncbi:MULTISPECIES: hypothetical protein [Rothia]|uniref:Uncharacterized protein n=1 Tax=Rothia kristinae TaxID=37923 RepID=A0A0Q2URE8_9MICC|nr:hypothetical protein [Rothia kristinae]TDP56631.1 hypothetical protein DEU33_0200 [Kocuria sp. AG109]SIM91143.1 Uncharacterised protein [Mycobacteroides abscessus subsp. abscessus]KTR38760.1 hypothetical protein RSA5_04110 [Rothia kristinae]KTR57177.1 hypothetical protein SA11R_06570 [Rothia kristinae]KTR69877.1 hypothetical protein SA12R_03340 [Rothia kristinae]
MSDPRGPRRIRHRGPRRATGGTTVSQGEPQRLAGFSARQTEAGSSRGTGVSGENREGSEDARGRWLREQRPPHWG